MADRVRISTKSTAADYDVVIQPAGIDQLSSYAQKHAHAHKYAIIADNNIAALYGPQALRALTNAGLTAHLFSFPAGEANKTVQRWEQLSFDMLFQGFGRDTSVIALGGGVTGDLGGFIAATYMRGIPVVQVPTSLLAMVDASIGGKTGVDAPAGKNLIGAFHQPAVVIIDPLVLKTLPDAELRFGLAEAVKHGAIADESYLRSIEQSIGAIVERDPTALHALIKRSVEIKAQHVSEDVHEGGARAALNFGHTIGHALEHVSDFSLPHGTAVALGIVAEATAGEVHGITEQGTADKLKRVIRAVGLPLAVEMDCDAILGATRSDKKTRAATQRYSLIARLGTTARTSDGEWTTALPDDVVREGIKSILV